MAKFHEFTALGLIDLIPFFTNLKIKKKLPLKIYDRYPGALMMS